MNLETKQKLLRWVLYLYIVQAAIGGAIGAVAVFWQFTQ